MKYERFEDLPVWNDAIVLAERVYLLVEDNAFRWKGDLGNQLQRASLSISNNIAEGFERGSTQELLTFLYYARGSAGEVRSMLVFRIRQSAFAHRREELEQFRSLAESISRQLRAWAESLQNSGIRGQRYLNDSIREGAARESRWAQFLSRLQELPQGSTEAAPS